MLRNRIKTLHHVILSTKESDLEKPIDRNPYEIFSDGLIDVLGFGTLCYIGYLGFMGWNGFANMIGLILAFGVIPFVIRNVRKAFMGET